MDPLCLRVHFTIGVLSMTVIAAVATAMVAAVVSPVPVVGVSAAHLVSAEVSMSTAIITMVTAVWETAVITVMRIVAVIYVTVKAAWAMEPPARSNKNSTVEPFRPVIPVWSTVIRGEIVVAVRT
jgi:hypothetical protein